MLLYRFASFDIFIGVEDLRTFQLFHINAIKIFTLYGEFDGLTSLCVLYRKDFSFIFAVIVVKVFVVLMGFVKHVFLKIKVVISFPINESWEFIIDILLCAVDVQKLLHPEHHLFVVSVTVEFGGNFSLGARSDVNE